jgi:hypothetical protein
MKNKDGFTLSILLIIFLLIGVGIFSLVYKFINISKEESRYLSYEVMPTSEQIQIIEIPSENVTSNTPTNMPTSTPTPTIIETKYPLHTNITATVFWVGEPVGGGSSEDNALSAWDDNWQGSFGGFDDPYNRNGYYPAGFTPLENPFYLDLPYSDFDDDGNRKANASKVIPWANEKKWGPRESMMKNRWVKLIKNGTVCYGQIEDAGPYEYDDISYVFGTARPKNTLANNAGMDVSPAIRDCLKFTGANNDSNQVDWQFVDAKDVPAGPWSMIVTTSQISWE